jgi:two-component system, LuxR family, response regulator FixJ
MVTSDPIITIVEDDDDVRRSMERIVASVGRKVDGYNSPTDFLAAFNPECCGCLILDLRMPVMSGSQLFQRLRELYAYVAPVIFVTGHGDVEEAVRAMRNGAWDFLEKPFSRNRLLDRMNEAIEFDRAMRIKQSERKVIEDRLESLTGREREVLNQVMAGSTTKEIAKHLGLSSKTVEGHRTSLFHKMGANSLPQLSLIMAKLAELQNLASCRYDARLAG